MALTAPSVWWKFGWSHVWLVTSQLSGARRDCIMSIAASTGVEVGETLGEGAMHLVTTKSCRSSSKFVMTLVQAKSVLTPAWGEALRHTVTECCFAINEAPNDHTAASNACAVANEKHFIPLFLQVDVAMFQPEHLATVFGENTKKRRHIMLTEVQTSLRKEALQVLALVPREMLQRPALSMQPQYSSRR